MALKLALNCSDQALQIAESLVCLLETELSLSLSSCYGSQSDEDRLIRKGEENRKKAEKHAKKILEGLDDGVASSSSTEWTSSDEIKLRARLESFKSERNLIKTTVVELESPHIQPLPNAFNLAEARKLDLETAVLMQVRNSKDAN